MWLKHAMSKLWMDPDFMLIGVPKCGTKALYTFLNQHPRIMAANTTRFQYFSHHYKSDSYTYKKQFAKKTTELYFRAKREKIICGESGESYFLHPLSPSRISCHYKDIKLLLILRDPVSRAYSHYQHMVKKGREQLSFNDALDAEDNRIKGQLGTLASGKPVPGCTLWTYSYKLSGLYADCLERWYESIPRENIMVIQNEKLRSSPQTTLAKCYDFLGVERYDNKFSLINKNTYNDIPEDTIERLSSFYGPHNEKLYEMIGQEFDWI